MVAVIDATTKRWRVRVCSAWASSRGGTSTRRRHRRFGILRRDDTTRWFIRLILQSRRFRQACRDYRLKQEFITPYTPAQNGMIERLPPVPSLKDECVWQQNFASFGEDGIRRYNEESPQSGSRVQDGRSSVRKEIKMWLDLRGEKLLSLFQLVPGPGLEPGRPKTGDFTFSDGSRL